MTLPLMMKYSIKRIWHPYWTWEELKYNMWGKVDNKDEMLNKAYSFMKQSDLWGKYMLKVVKKWKYSCEYSLTANINKQAWIGAAAVALKLKCPEDITREVWSKLSDKERENANKEADKAIKYWYNYKLRYEKQ